jgi:urease accessory protein
MLRALKVLPRGSFQTAIDSITLDSEARYRRRIALTGDKGTEFLLDLPDAAVIGDGDGLELQDGRVIIVRAAEEALTEVTAATPHDLLRLAWHIGNRHIPAEIHPDRFLIRPDPVIAEMLVGLGAQVRDVRGPFAPEGGAYARHHDHLYSDADGDGDG